MDVVRSCDVNKCCVLCKELTQIEIYQGNPSVEARQTKEMAGDA